MGHTPVKFKTDTGADVTLLSEEIYKLTGLEKLRKAKKKLFGPRDRRCNGKPKDRKWHANATRYLMWLQILKNPC